MRNFSALIGLILVPASFAADWPNFRGPAHDGICTEKGLKTSFPEGGPKRLWEQQIGDSFSGLSVVADKLFTCGTENKKQILICMNASDGTPVWKTPIEDAYFEAQGGSGTRSTPTIHDGMIYVQGALGRLIAVRSADGTLVWDKKFSDPPQWGFSASVLIEGDLAIVAGGGKNGGLVAFDRKTGAERWRAGSDRVGYATPYPFTLDGTRYIVGFLGTKALIVQAADGAIVWEQNWKTDWDVNAAAPIFHDGYLFLGSGYDTGSAVFQVRKAGAKLVADNIWGRIDKVLLAKFQSAVLHNGALYCSDQRRLACVDFMTGKEQWKEPRIKDSTLVLADGHLFVFSESGELLIAPASAKEFKPLARVRVVEGSKCWTVPTIAGGKLYVRNMDTVRAFSLVD